MGLMQTPHFVICLCWCWSFAPTVVVPQTILHEMSLSDLWKRPEFNQDIFENDTIDMIKKRGYPVEVHHVTTKDGYILQLHRIPSGREPTAGAEAQKHKRVVYLQHGLVSTDHVWVLNPSDKSLAYLLADRGYDVWMGNSRGSTTSRAHVVLDTTKKEYWQFTWDEMAYDIQAGIDFILQETGQQRLSFVGHSLGCALFFIAMIQEPQLNEKIDVMFALGSATNLNHFTGTMKRLANVWKLVLKLRFLFQNGPFIDHPRGITNKLQKEICTRSLLGAKLCRNYLFTIFGFSNLNNFNLSSAPGVLSHYPSGVSFNAFAHFYQIYFSKEFKRFDYGREENLQRYGQEKPPMYDLSQVTAPVVLFYGDGDYISPPEDVNLTASLLGNLRENIRVDDPDFTHGDFIWSTRVVELVYNSILSHLPAPF